MVTSMSQEERQRTPHQVVGSQSIALRKEFFVPMPNDEASFRNRSEDIGSVFEDAEDALPQQLRVVGHDP